MKTMEAEKLVRVKYSTWLRLKELKHKFYKFNLNDVVVKLIDEHTINQPPPKPQGGK